MCFVYVLQSLKNGKLYVGSTNDLKRRLLEHHSGQSKFTRENSPLDLVFKQEFPNLLSARKAEKWLKNQKSRAFINKVIFDGKIDKVF